jgi:hypothetical protein
VVKLKMICRSTTFALSALPLAALLSSEATFGASVRGFAGGSPTGVGAVVSIPFDSQCSGAPKGGLTDKAFDPFTLIPEVAGCTSPRAGNGLPLSDLDLGRRSLEDLTANRAGKFGQGTAPSLSYQCNSAKDSGQANAFGVVKPDLIDLEPQKWATGRKQAQAVQRERLSDWAPNWVMRQSDLRYNCQEGGEEDLKRSSRLPICRSLKVTEVDNQTFQWYSGYQTLNIAPSQVFTAAEFPIRQAAVAVSISGLEELQNSGEEAIIDLLESRIMNAEDTFMNGLSQGVYGDGTVSNSVSGLQLLVASSPTTGVVGGIDRSQWAFWQNQTWSAATNGGVVLSAASILQQMDSLWVQLVRGRDYPDLIIMDNVMYKYYLASLQSIQRIGPENTVPEMAEYGFQSLKYLNADVVLDGGFQGFSTDPLPFQTSAGTSAVGGAPSTTGYFLNGSVTVH